MKKIYDGLPVHDYTTKFSVSIVYAILASIAMNYFYLPGNIYSSGLTGLAQILTTLSTKIVGFNVPVSITLYLLNVPLFFIAWKKIGKKYTIFTFITVTLTSLFMHIVPQTVMTQDPIICAIWWGDFWIRNWFCLKKRGFFWGLRYFKHYHSEKNGAFRWLDFNLF